MTEPENSPHDSTRGALFCTAGMQDRSFSVPRSGPTSPSYPPCSSPGLETYLRVMVKSSPTVPHPARLTANLPTLKGHSLDFTKTSSVSAATPSRCSERPAGLAAKLRAEALLGRHCTAMCSSFSSHMFISSLGMKISLGGSTGERGKQASP